MCVQEYVYMCMCVCLCVYEQVCVYVHECVYVCVCVCVYVHECVCVCVCMSACAHRGTWKGAGFLLPCGVVTGWPTPVFSTVITPWSHLRSYPEALLQDSGFSCLGHGLSLEFLKAPWVIPEYIQDEKKPLKSTLWCLERIQLG